MDSEMIKIRDQCQVLVDYIRELGGGAMMNEFDVIIQKTFEKKNIKGLRKILKDLTEWAAGLSPNGKNKVEEILGEAEKKSLIVVSNILNNDKIKNVEEYKSILAYVEKYFDNPEKKESVIHANRLLAGYRDSEEE